MSTSLQFRTKGNEEFNSALDGDGAPKRRIARFNQATNSYYRALQTACDNNEKSSACKNIGKTYWKIVEVLRDNPHLMDDPVKMIFNFQESVKRLCQAHQFGQGVKSTEWLDDIDKSIDSVIKNGLKFFSEQDYKVRVKAIENFISSVHIDHYRADLFLQLAGVIFHHGIIAIQDGDFNTCLQAMHNCHHPIEEARRFSRGGRMILDEADILEDDVFINRSVAESIQARLTGDSLLQYLLQDESFNMDMVFEVIDWYRRAIILTREKQVEEEAIALSKLGQLYDKVLKLKYKAKENFMRCISLAESLHPKTFNSEDWYKQCSQTLARYQQEEVQRDEASEQKERDKYLNELKTEMEDLKTNYKAVDEFLVYVYKQHPPRVAAGTEQPKLDKKALDGGEYSTIKKILLKAISHYHPDRQCSSHGKTWKVLCEEITKMLTRKYETFK